ncbi:MAG: hypothetical protein L0Y55_05565 [Anaerolineales bacterium]|nr:hypothetical protein [Anaerolineales bacterium]
MPDLKIELPKSVPADDRAELLRALEASARVETGATRKFDLDVAQTLFVIAATVQTVDIVWRWFQALRAKHANKKLDVVIATPDGKQVHLEKVTLEELKRIFD